MRLRNQLNLLFLAIALILFSSSVLFHFVYKPYMEKKLIARGISEIEKVDPNRNNKLAHINNAESIFRNIEKNYVSSPIRAYNRYGIAYLKAAEFDLSFQKLSKSLSINRNEPSTLYSLGLFFAATPDDYFNHFDYKPLLKSVQFPETLSLKTRNDIALFFTANHWLLIPAIRNQLQVSKNY